MLLPITAFGHPTLKKVAQDIDKDYPNLDVIINDMFETMYYSKGVGLAAPQIDLSIRLITIDASPFAEDYPEANGFKKVMINAHIIEEEGIEWSFNEGCLSVPDIREDVLRKPKIRIQFVDENFVSHDEIYEGVVARIIQHEYDHLEGILFVERLTSLKKMLLKRKLTDISKGNIKVDYRMKFPFQYRKKIK
ncbi:MAG: peptide deformylase [Bacteroidetes bacterium]|nr:peptide deformylase [Bacteroidota bacterium]